MFWSPWRNYCKGRTIFAHRTISHLRAMHLRDIAQLCVSPAVAVPPRLEVEDRRFEDYLMPLAEWTSSPPRIALVGVPQDIGVARNGGRRGAAAAPAAIRAALGKLAASIGEVMLSPEVSICDCGLVRTDGLPLEEIHQRQEYIVGRLLDVGANVLVLGGGHDTALPDGRALGKRVERLGIVNVDAHLDVRIPTDDGSHSGSPFRELIEDDACPLELLIEFGTQRFSASAHHVRYVREHGYIVWMLDDIRRCSLEVALADVELRLAECDGIMLSLDVDALASAYAPGVSAPAGDGFQPAEVAAIIERIASMPQCRLVDIVEVNPSVDADERTVRLAAYFAALTMWTFAHRRDDASSPIHFRPASDDH
jgi:formiminoglutamase